MFSPYRTLLPAWSRVHGDGIHHSILRDLHWLPVWHHVNYKLALLVYKSLHGLALSHLADDCILASSDKFRHCLRSADVDTCIILRTHTRFGDRSFPAAGPGSGTAGCQNCDGQTLSLVKSVDYWRHFCLCRDSQNGGALVTLSLWCRVQAFLTTTCNDKK